MNDEEAIEVVQDMAELEYWRQTHRFEVDWVHWIAVTKIRAEAKAKLQAKINERERK